MVTKKLVTFKNSLISYRTLNLENFFRLTCNVEHEYTHKKGKLDKNDPFYFALVERLNQKREEDLESVELFLLKKRKGEKVPKDDKTL